MKKIIHFLQITFNSNTSDGSDTEPAQCPTEANFAPPEPARSPKKGVGSIPKLGTCKYTINSTYIQKFEYTVSLLKMCKSALPISCLLYTSPSPRD